MCPPLPKHIHDSFTSTGHRSSYTTLLGAECQSERRKLDSFCCAPTVTCELVGLLLYTLQHCSMKKGCLQKCQAAPSQLTSVQNFTLPHLTRLSCEWLQSGKRMDLSTRDCVKLYVSSDDSRNPCPTHTSDSSACACSHTILLGVSERQSQTKCTNLLSCFFTLQLEGVK